jgi:HTH-type transcriptional regulator, sugar sensing transcriptional regulator
MKNEQIIALVKELGLTDFEARVYFAALSLGPTTALKLAHVSDIKRATVYNVIDDLVQKGFMRIEPRGFKRLFAAENPKALERALEYRRERFREILPTLEGLYNQREGSSVIKYYEGLPAVKGVYEDLLTVLRSHDSYMVIADMEKWMAADPEFFSKWREKRGRLNLESRMLFEDNEAGRKFLQLAPNNFEVAKLLPPGKHVDTSLVITPHRAIIHQYTEPVSVLVNESQASIRLYGEMFDVMWDALVEIPD